MRRRPEDMALAKQSSRTGSFLVALALLMPFGGAHAAVGPGAASNLRALTSQCITQAAQRFQLHPDILYAILMVEGGTVGKDSKANKNGSYDIGLFQLNSIHRDTFKALGVSEELLRNDGCVNATAAAWHLHRTLTPEVVSKIQTEDDYLRAIALYHSATPQYNIIYAEKLRKAFSKLYASSPK